MTPDHDDVLALVERLLPLVDVVKLSEEDAAWLYPGRSPEEVLRHHLSRGVGVAAMTLGARGCLVATGTGRVWTGSAATTVVDTIGAGDAFMSGLLFALLSRGLAGAVRTRTLTGADLRALARTATASAALTVARAGATPPTLEELLGALTPAGTDGDVGTSG